MRDRRRRSGNAIGTRLGRAKVGEITETVARMTGLPSGTPVIAGGNDQPCAGLGMGMIGPGKVMLSTGTAWVIMSVVDAETDRCCPRVGQPVLPCG